MRIPYRGAEPWAHDTLVFIGFLLVALATVLACLPRGDARPGLPLAAAVVVGVLVGVPSVSLESSSPVLVGLVFTALLVAYLRIDRIRRDAMVLGGRDGRGRPARRPSCSRRASTPTARSSTTRRSRARCRKTDGSSFNWSHGYGPLNWPRTGRELLRIQTDRAAYWKATNLVEFDGIRWTTGGDRWLPSVDSSEVPDERRLAGASGILVTVRGLRTTQVIGAGTTLSVGELAPARARIRPRALRDRGRPAHLRPGLHGRGVRAGAEPPCPGRRADDLPALQPGVPEHGAADAGRRPAVDRRDRELPGLALLPAGPVLALGVGPGDPRWTSRRSAATRATAPRPWRPRATRARGR